MNKALIMVDLQNDFMPTGALPVPRGDELIPLANALQTHFDLILATQDWHPREHGSFAANHPGRSPGDYIELAGLMQVLWPTHCVQETEGAALVKTLDVDCIAHVFQKGSDPNIDSYSGFFDNSRTHSTGLNEYLRAKQVNSVYIMGLALDYCVKHTVLDACQLGFETFLIEDACRSVESSPDWRTVVLREMQAAGAQLIQMTDIERIKRSKL